MKLGTSAVRQVFGPRAMSDMIPEIRIQVDVAYSIL